MRPLCGVWSSLPVVADGVRRGVASPMLPAASGRGCGTVSGVVCHVVAVILPAVPLYPVAMVSGGGGRMPAATDAATVSGGLYASGMVWPCTW